jgi:hypothetical protein
MAKDFGSSSRHIRRRISRYVPADVTPRTGQKTSKMWNYFFAGALIPTVTVEPVASHPELHEKY